MLLHIEAAFFILVTEINRKVYTYEKKESL